MQSISTAKELKAKIQLLELQSKQQGESLKYRWHLAYESIKPQNLILNAFKDTTEVPEVKQNMINTVVGIATGLLTRNLMVGSSAGIIKKFAATAVQLGITRLVANNFSAIRQKAQEFLHSKEKKNGSAYHDIE